MSTLTIDETATKAYDSKPGTLFAIWVYQGTGGSGHNTAPGTYVSADADFYNSLKLISVTGGIEAVGAPVPVPGAIWLLGSGLIALVGIRRRG